MVGKPTVLYSTRPKRGPIEALLMILPGRLTTACIPRVLSVAPLKLFPPSLDYLVMISIPRVLSVAPLKRIPHIVNRTKLVLYSTRPKRGPIEAGHTLAIFLSDIGTYSTRPKRGPIEANPNT